MTGAATPLDAWWAASLPVCRTLADRAETLGLADRRDVMDAVTEGVKKGMRPARALQAAGVLTFDTVWILQPEPVPAEPAPAEPAPAEPATADSGSSPTASLSAADPLRFNDVDLKVASQVPMATVARLRLLPYRIDDSGNVLIAHAAASEPHNAAWQEMAAAVRAAFDGSTARLMPHLPETVSTCLEQVKLELAQENDQHDETEEEQTQRALENFKALTKPTSTAVGAQSGHALAQLLLDAVGRNSSDIHIFGARNRMGVQCYQARLRTDGALRPFAHDDGTPREIPTAVGRAIVARIVAAGLMDENARMPRSGRFEIAFPENPSKQYDLRVEITPQHGEGFLTVIRLLSTADKPLGMDFIYPPDESSLAADTAHVLDDMRSGGLFMVCGATGSGKTTFLAGAMSHLNDPRKHLLTIEHPIEKRIEGVRQLQVEPSVKGMGWVPLIESSLRLDPDGIMIGELRSKETAETAILAAETGHMVLSTMHTNSAAATPARFKHLGVPPGDLSNVLRGVLAQSLVATRCENCVRQNRPSAGCVHCEGSGWKGRAAVGELMVATPEVRDMIADGASPSALEAASGHSVKAVHAGRLIASGKTDANEVADKLGVTAARIAETTAAAAAEPAEPAEGGWSL